MLLINTTSELKAHLSGVWLNTKIELFLVLIEQATDKYIVPAIGNDMYQQLVAQPVASLSQEDQYLHKKLARAVAYYAMYEGLPSLDAAVGDFGIVSHSTDNRQPVSKWRFQNYLQDAAEKADYWLEHALVFLETNQDNYPTWTASADYALSQGLLLKSATEITRFFPAVQNRRAVYLRVRPFIQNCEEKYLRDEISDGLFTQIKDLISDPNAVVSSEEAKLLRLLRLYLAAIAMYEAHYTLATELTAHGFRSLYANDAQSWQQDQPANDSQLTAFRERSWNDAQSHRRELRTWLDKTATDILFVDYFNSTLYPVAGVNSTYQMIDNSFKTSFRM